MKLESPTAKPFSFYEFSQIFADVGNRGRKQDQPASQSQSESECSVPTASDRPQGRPRQFDADAVLEAALQYFWHNGIRTTTRQLEQAVGVSQSSIYNAFGSKSDLLDRVLGVYAVRVEQQVIDPLNRADCGLDGINRFFADHYRWATQHGQNGCLLINLMAEDGGLDPMIARHAQRYRNRIRTALRDALERAARAGETFACDIDSRTELLMCLVLGFNISARAGASRTTMNRMLQSVQDQTRGWRLNRS
ncbi:MAG: TetR/AcrR family transcriptional regulator [Xanthomonadaceae bacterium]|nr:TetR/AcrR family transcriptional regulator [Xanthomonadaceae bacterium]